ncbi:TetR/AcrR family transcriptional regulator [Streptomyces sp. NPDC020983]|uniref:TetR/AcrR family transcriptional regulator n=1 Tax=Streptomyces sp. NPDC020983 TaxID=3365106 RepID=UPI003793AF2C
MRADARRNRELLLRAAQDAFAEEGIGVPLDEVARRAGVGPGTLYRHFPTKEALFEAVVHERLRELAARAREAADAADPGAAFFGFVAHMVREAAPKQDLVDALGGAGAELQTALAATAGELREEVGRLLARAQRSGAVRPDLGAGDLMALLSGLLHALRGRSRDPAAPADQEVMTAVLCDGLAARPGR